MALYDCQECGHKVSDAAKACPNCGAPPKKKPKAILGPLLVFCAAGIVIIVMLGDFSDSPKSHMRDSGQSKSRSASPSRSLQSVLGPFFKDIHVVQWVVYNGDEVYVGFKANYDYSKPEPLKLIMGNAAKLAYDAGHRGFELWAVDAMRTDRTWRPENGIEAWLLTKITSSGVVIHT